MFLDKIAKVALIFVFYRILIHKFIWKFAWGGASGFYFITAIATSRPHTPGLIMCNVSLNTTYVHFSLSVNDSILFDSIRFDSIRFYSIRFDSIRFDFGVIIGFDRYV